MIRAYLFNGQPMVWNADDWLKLRKDHRVIGNLIGSVANLPRQQIFAGLPMTFLPEEVTLLREKKILELVTLKDPADPPSKDVKKKYLEYVEKVNKEQVKYYEEERKRQVLSMIDIIVEGKKRKLMNLKSKQAKSSVSQVNQTNEDVDFDKEAIFKSEMQKASTVSPSLLQTFTEDPWYTENDYVPAEWNFPSTKEEALRYKVFKDLWETNYYLTSGKKFGGDYLVYPGEPVKFHSFAIVQCKDYSTPIEMTDLIMHSRMGSSTRKTFVIASENQNGDIVYQSVQWAEMS